MELIDRILSDGNIEAAIHAVKSNRGAAGIDKMTVDALEWYFAMHGEEIKEQIRATIKEQIRGTTPGTIRKAATGKPLTIKRQSPKVRRRINP